MVIIAFVKKSDKPGWLKQTLSDILTHRFTEANFTCPLPSIFYFYLPKIKIYLPWAIGPGFLPAVQSKPDVKV